MLIFSFVEAQLCVSAWCSNTSVCTTHLITVTQTTFIEEVGLHTGYEVVFGTNSVVSLCVSQMRFHWVSGSLA